MAMYAVHMAKHYRTTNLFMPWGEDFAYGNAWSDFTNGDALIRYWNSEVAAELGMTMKYSTTY